MEKIKIIFMGSAFSGKTSIFNKCTKNEFNSISKTEMTKKIIEIGNNKKEITFIDFPNFDPFGTQNLSYISQINYFIIICDLTDEHYWKKFKSIFHYVYDFEKRKSIIVIFNKSDISKVNKDEIYENIKIINKQNNCHLEYLITSAKEDNILELLMPFLMKPLKKDELEKPVNIIKSKSLNDIKRKKPIMKKGKSCNIQ